MVRKLFSLLEAYGAAPARIVCAESLTAGLLSSCIAAVPGASRYLWGGMVCYQSESKERMLAVPASLIVEQGLVSEAVARQMALAALYDSDADFAVALTGEAGPLSSGPAPKGRVWIALAQRSGSVDARSFDFKGTRNRIRNKAVLAALQGLCVFVEESSRVSGK